MNDQQNLASPPEWLAALDRADADVAAGRIASGESIKRRLRQTLAEVKIREGVLRCNSVKN